MNHKITLPSISELSALAANIHTAPTAASKVAMALEIWEASHKALDHQEWMRTEAKAIKARNYDERIRACNYQGVIKLTQFLKRLFPQSKVEDRMKWYRDYLKAILADPKCNGADEARIRFVQYPEWPKTSDFKMADSAIDKLVLAMIQKEKTEGMSNPRISAIGFLKYRDQAEGFIKSDKASKGGIARKEKNRNAEKTIRTQKKAAKTPQAKKKKP
jgi:hypothetical protein